MKRLLKLLVAALLLAAGAQLPAQTPSPAGRWALHADGRTILIVELRQDAAAPGGWSGSFTRPARFELSGELVFSAVRGPISDRRIRAVEAQGDTLTLTVERPPTDSEVFLFQAGEGYAELRLRDVPLPPLVLAPAGADETVDRNWDAARSYAAEFAWPDNDEMARLFDADQAARAHPATIDWAVVGPDDARRRTATKTLLDAGRLRTAGDFYRAAFVFQHGDQPADFLIAHSLAIAAAARGRRDAAWIAAATLDRYLQNVGQRQIYGTQYRFPPGEPTTQDPYDRALVSDRLREALGVPTLAGQGERMREMEAMRPAATRPR